MGLAGAPSISSGIYSLFKVLFATVTQWEFLETQST